MRYTTAFLFFLFLIIFSSCPKDACEVDYHLEIPIEIFPVQQSYFVGDTIFISSTYVTDSMVNLNTSEMININDLEFGFELLLAKFDSISITDGLDFVDYNSLQGEIGRFFLVGVSALSLVPESNGTRNQIKFYIIPQEIGNYQIGFTTFYGVFEEVILSNPVCDEKLRVSISTNGGQDNNFELYANNSIDTNVTLEGYTNGGGFSFIVEE